MVTILTKNNHNTLLMKDAIKEKYFTLIKVQKYVNKNTLQFGRILHRIWILDYIHHTDSASLIICPGRTIATSNIHGIIYNESHKDLWGPGIIP